MHDSKTCFKCGVHQYISEFYKHNGMADGHLNKCKSCSKKDSKNNRLEKIDYYLEYDRQRAMLPHNVNRRKEYQKTTTGKESVIKSKKKWIENNLIKRSAHIILGNAVRDGKVIKKYKCEECGINTSRIHGHHDDYSKPLEVRWLCSKCHTTWHKINGEGLHCN